ncbi:divalent-cation tolerance protein CutA [Flavilitoribacter nigricans]|uniref:Divalent-cation tolerance protein CutA n=1 Tax=Flavilitoribacter nigricans (strain ATCC 23147 / DSM 23189 / NBRC 102662 / NCIMB 1420 / SS-2) TaxID=1122177 RepID=A0A2D0N890_FLAN2|nr:divalent-cation tolerance protein CutA [Flavilitoribacter nigricans]PHN04734.1 hypothetical protein CRP01_19660 [Flavilitoribacter nigricans DSM 23189 = NBRC 102662]
MEIQIQVTTPDKEIAQAIAHDLVANRLAACVQLIGPITSTYWWEGKIESGEECLLLIKTTQDRYPEVEQTILELHPYEVPEIIATEIRFGLAPYREWIRSETGA